MWESDCNHYHGIIASDLDQVINDLIKKVYDQKVKAGDVDVDSWKATTEEYWKAIKEGWDKLPKFFSTAQLSMLELRRNVNMFAAFKNHANVLELTQGLYGADGKPVSFSEFKKLSKVIDEKYNVNWLQAEYNYAVNAAQAAAQWITFKEKGGKLEYKTIGDGRVRDEHRKLEGTILPVDHPFWTIYYPPNGWGCRCYIRWRPADVDDKAPNELPDVKEMFRNNVGITSQVFTSEHPFIKEIGPYQAQAIQVMAEKETMRWERAFITQLAKDGLVGKEVLAAGNKVITFTASGIKEATNQPHEFMLDKNRAVLNIESLLKNSDYVGIVPSQNKDITIRQFHYWSFEIKGKVSYIVAKELFSGQIVFYTITDTMKLF